MARHQRLLLPLLTLLIALALAVPALAADQPFKATLGPPTGIESDGTGLALFTLQSEGPVLEYSLMVFGLNNVTQAHIHQGGPTEDGPIVAWLYPAGPPPTLVPGVFNGVLMEGTIEAADLMNPLAGMTLDDLVDLIEQNQAYVNVHTSANPGGEIRGQIVDLGWPDITQPLLDTYDLELFDLAMMSDGFVDGTWKPYASMPRRHFVKMMVEAFGVPTAMPDTPTFDDVPAGHLFFPWIEGAHAAGLVLGITEDMFGPDLVISREQAAAVIARHKASQLGLNLEEMFTAEQIADLLGDFSDGDSVSTGLREEMAFAVHFGIVLGNTAGQLNPRVQLSRIQGAAMLARAAENTIALPGDAVFPEGVAFSEASGFFFVGSTQDGTIFRGSLGDPGAEVFLAGGEDERTMAVGMKVDEQGRLIIAGGATGMVWVYDIEDGSFITSFSNGLGADATFLNDLTVAANGDVFITDSFGPTIWRIPEADLDPAPGGQPLEAWLDVTTTIPFPEGFNLNGIVTTPDGENLLTVQANTGLLFHIDISTQTVTEVDLGDLLLNGGDGLLLDGQQLFVVGSGRLRVVELATDFLSGELVETLIDPSFHSPTTAAFANGVILVVNSQFDRQGGTPDLPFRVSVVPR